MEVPGGRVALAGLRRAVQTVVVNRIRTALRRKKSTIWVSRGARIRGLLTLPRCVFGTRKRFPTEV